jgi:hypothetical protein
VRWLMDAASKLRALDALLAEGRSTFAWALEHAVDGDPIPDLWDACDDWQVMLSLAARRFSEATSEALRDAAQGPGTYPHARDCLMTAARYLSQGATREAGSWVDSAVVHYPGRGTARPQPEKGRVVEETLCRALRARVALTLDGV